MKILHIHDHLESVGGAEIYLSEICRGLQERGHKIIRLYLLSKETKRTIEDGTYRLDRPHGLLHGLAKRQQLVDLLRRESPDVVHLHTLFNPVWVNTLLDRYPVILTLHSIVHLCFLTSKIRSDTGQVCKTPMGWHCVTSRCYRPMEHGGWLLGNYQAIVRLRYLHLLPLLTRIIAPSQAMEQELLKVGVPTGRVVRIPHFTTFRDELPTIPSHRSILFAGRLSWEKGILEFIDMLALLAESDWSATIVGDGPLREVAQSQARERKIRERIRFCGRVSRADIGSYFRAARVVVFPSIIPEAFGLVGIEAMAYSRPVVAFDLGGVREWLNDGKTGFVVPPGDIKEMADRVNRLLMDPALGETMGRNGKQRVESGFGWETHLNGLLTVYQDASNSYATVNNN